MPSNKFHNQTYTNAQYVEYAIFYFREFVSNLFEELGPKGCIKENDGSIYFILKPRTRYTLSCFLLYISLPENCCNRIFTLLQLFKPQIREPMCLQTYFQYE